MNFNYLNNQDNETVHYRKYKGSLFIYANHLIFSEHTLASKEFEMINRLKFPPFVTRLKFFAPLGPKNEKCPKYPQNMKKLCFRNIEKNLIKS